ncbi:MAG: T9SS type A sorting domain-containing protein [Bacteroidota bacterium]
MRFLLTLVMLFSGLSLLQANALDDIELSQDSFWLCVQDTSLTFEIDFGSDYDIENAEHFRLYFTNFDILYQYKFSVFRESSLIGKIKLTPLARPADGIYFFTLTIEDDTSSFQKELFLEVLSTPPNIALISPIDEQMELDVENSRFEWEGTGNIADYTLMVATDATLDSVVYQITTSNTFFGLTESLLPNQIYYWQVTANNKCDTTASPVFQFSTENLVHTQNIFSLDYQICPNPTTDWVKIEFGSDNSQLVLYGSHGQLLEQRNFTAYTSLDLSAYPSGVYWVELRHSTVTFVEKVLKK